MREKHFQADTMDKTESAYVLDDISRALSISTNYSLRVLSGIYGNNMLLLKLLLSRALNCLISKHRKTEQNNMQFDFHPFLKGHNFTFSIACLINRYSN